MAKYNIRSLNYIASGEARDFINMDIELGYQVYDYVHLLCAEAGSRGYPDIDSWRKQLMSNDISVDIGTEHGAGDFYPTNYICRDNNLPLSRENARTEIILNEQQKYFNEADHEKRTYIRLYLSCCTNEMLGRIHEFNRARELPNQTYLLENTPNDKNNITCAGGIHVRNAYDIRDVSVRRLGRSESRNEFLAGREMQYQTGTGSYTPTHHDIYAPPMHEQPLGFCQSNSPTGFEEDALVITRGSTAMPRYFESDMEQHRGSEVRKQYFDMSITQQKPRSYTYRPYDSEYQISDAFWPERSYDNIARSFVLDLPVSYRLSQNAITSDYGCGEIYYRRLMTCKNLYDSQYSMNMPSRQTLSAARTYCGINTCAGQAYLKYWDDINYSVTSSQADYFKTYCVEQSGVYGGTKSTDVKPYQKIEYLYPNDYISDAKHKTNAFSIEILSTGIGQLESQTRAAVQSGGSSPSEISAAYDRLSKLEVLKRDITAAVRDIVRNVAPANTQLVDVYFNDN